jgi:hypothetical protein
VRGPEQDDRLPAHAESDRREGFPSKGWQMRPETLPRAGREEGLTLLGSIAIPGGLASGVCSQDSSPCCAARGDITLCAVRRGYGRFLDRAAAVDYTNRFAWCRDL